MKLKSFFTIKSPEDNIEKTAQVTLDRIILDIDGALKASYIGLEIFNSTLEKVGEHKFPKLISEIPYPPIFPFLMIYEHPEKRMIYELMKGIEGSIARFGTLGRIVESVIGEKIVICGFPFHIRNMLKMTNTSIRIVEPPFLDEDGKKKLCRQIEEFKESNGKGDIKMCNFDFISFARDIDWADSIIIETFGIDRYRNDDVHVPEYVARAIDWVKEKIPIYLVVSELQLGPKYKNYYLEGVPVSLDFFEDLIMENGFQYFTSNSFLR